MTKIKDTKVGQWLKANAPKVLDVVGDLLPSNGVFGVVKNAINIIQPDLPIEQKLEFTKLEQQFEKEILELEIKDREGARNREVEYVKATGHADWMQIIIGVMIMLSFFAGLILIGFKPIPTGNEHIMINAIGIMEGLVLSVASYYFGSSLGSKIKDLKK